MSSMQRQGRQTGVVSIMATMVMMIVITLIVLGFAEIARTEQRSVLDDQLSIQAYYAAESGINDARQVINSAISAGGVPKPKTTCDDQNGYNFNSNSMSMIDSAHGVSYTCVLINVTPPALTYAVGKDNSTVIPLMSSAGTPFNSLTLSWQQGSGLSPSPTGCPNTLPASGQGQFPPASQWAGCNYPVMRIDLLDANSAFARPNWASQTMAAFLVPYDTSTGLSVINTVDFGTAKGQVQAQMVQASCPNSSGCTATINGLAGSKYYMRVSTFYQTNSSLTVSSPGQSFSGAQAVIDSTGKAQDVLRRIVVAADLTDANIHNIPTAAIISKYSICKQFEIANGTAASGGEYFQNDDLSSGGNGNIYCQQKSVGTPAP